MIGCDVLEPEPTRGYQRPVATPEQLATCVANLERWYREALDERTAEIARAAGLTERQIAAILGRS